jgi:hypothetical protein
MRRRLVSLVVRWRFVILFAVTLAAGYAALERPFNDDWRFFVWGSRLLFGDHPSWAHEPGGLHLYANYQAQIGPLTLVAAAALRLLGDEGARIAAMVLGMAVVCGGVIGLERVALTTSDAAMDSTTTRYVTLVGGLIAVLAWSNLAVSAVHLDDVFAVALSAGAIFSVARGSPAWTGILVGLAVAAKPWALILAPLPLAFAGSPRRRAIVAMFCTTAVTWGPFLIADPGTLTAGAPRVLVHPASVLALFGVDQGSASDWLRAVQLAVCVLVVAMAVLNGRWHAALMVGVAARLLLDPAVFDYYSVALVVGVLLWEILRKEPRLPLLTALSFAALMLAAVPLDPSFDRLQGLLRLLTCGVALVVPYLEHCSDRTEKVAS